jgi:hypothetical protein
MIALATIAMGFRLGFNFAHPLSLISAAASTILMVLGPGINANWHFLERPWHNEGSKF